MVSSYVTTTKSALLAVRADLVVGPANSAMAGPACQPNREREAERDRDAGVPTQSGGGGALAGAWPEMAKRWCPRVRARHGAPIRHGECTGRVHIIGRWPNRWRDLTGDEAKRGAR